MLRKPSVQLVSSPGAERSEAEELFFTLHAYQKYEGKERIPRLDELLSLADYFDVSLDYLVGRSDVRERR